MLVNKTNIEGVLLIEPKVYSDNRGFFYESFNNLVFQKHVPGVKFVQDNDSLSHKGVLRGIHFQIHPYAQGKLVRVVKGSVVDVVVDIRQNSPTFGMYEKFILTENNKFQLWIPEGMAHGFLSLEDNTLFSYKCTQFYNKESERSILWNDNDLNIDWGIESPIISDKDMNAPSFKFLIENNQVL